MGWGDGHIDYSIKESTQHVIKALLSLLAEALGCSSRR